MHWREASYHHTTAAACKLNNMGYSQVLTSPEIADPTQNDLLVTSVKKGNRCCPAII